MEPQILLASSNTHKLEEISAILPEFSFVSASTINLSIEPKEDGNSFYENACLKALEYYNSMQKLDIPLSYVLAEDSGICIEALDGRPGIYSARYALEPHSSRSSFTQNPHFQCDKILEEMQGIVDRRAYFICCAVFIWNHSPSPARSIEECNMICSQARWNGKISHSISGKGGFGYDPIFFVPEFDCNSAELPSSVKNSVSHRAIALQNISHSIHAILANTKDSL